MFDSLLPRHFFVMLAATTFTSISPTPAAIVTYTDSSAFLADISGSVDTLDFDTLTAGDVIADGDNASGITFSYDFGGVQLQVSDAFDTTSGPNFLGTTDSDQLLDGDDFVISFGPSNAIGLSIITADELFDGDLTLTVGATSVGIAVADLQQTLPDGAYVYFLGIIDDTNTFSSASLTTIGGGFFFYNVDDIVIGNTATATVPEPSSMTTFALLGLSAALLRASRGRWTRRGQAIA